MTFFDDEIYIEEEKKSDWVNVVMWVSFGLALLGLAYVIVNALIFLVKII